MVLLKIQVTFTINRFNQTLHFLQLTNQRSSGIYAQIKCRDELQSFLALDLPERLQEDLNNRMLKHIKYKRQER